MNEVIKVKSHVICHFFEYYSKIGNLSKTSEKNNNNIYKPIIAYRQKQSKRTGYNFN